MVRVLIVDDHAHFRHFVADLIEASDGLQVVGECPDGESALAAAPALLADVVLMDYRMAALTGAEATSQLVATNPDVRVLMLTGESSDRVRDQAERSGCSGFVTKGGDPLALVEAIRVVAGGGTVWPPSAPPLQNLN